MCERIIEDYARTYGMNYMNLRLFNVAGSDGGKLGYQKDPIKHVLPILVQRGLLGQVFTINGVNYPTDDGTVIRDYTHVSDVARAFVATTHWIIDQQLSGVLNIGNNNPVSMLELVKEVEEQLETTIETHNAVERDGDMIQTHADISTTEKVLGCQPALIIKDIVADEI